MATITSANSVLVLGATNLFNTPIQIEGFATDDAFAIEDVETAETMMGVDGKLSAGFTPYEVPMEISLQADSSSNLFFDTLIQAEAVAKEKYELNGAIEIPSIGYLFTFTRGFLSTSSVIPTAKKVLQPRKFKIIWQNITRAPV